MTKAITETETETKTTDNVTIRVFDVDADAGAAADTDDRDPVREWTGHNVTRGALHEEIISGLIADTAAIGADKLVLGDSAVGTDTLAQTTAVGNEVFRTSITDQFQDGQTATFSTFLDSTEASGQVIEEIALVRETGSGDRPINRVVIDDPGDLLAPKASNETVTIDIQLTQEDATA